MKQSDEWEIRDSYQYKNWEFLSGRGVDLEMLQKEIDSERFKLRKLRKDHADAGKIETAKLRIKNCEKAVSQLQSKLVQEFLAERIKMSSSSDGE